MTDSQHRKSAQPVGGPSQGASAAPSGIDASNARPTRVLIVDDHPLFREGCRQFLSRQDGFQCCGEAGDFESAESVTRECQPAVILLDVRLHDREGIELIPVLRKAVPGVRILMASAYDDLVHVERALRAGADGYFTKEQGATELITALRTVLAGQLYLPQQLSTVLLRQMLLQPPAPAQSGVGSLSPREFEIFQLLGGGLSTREVAERLGISIKTVESHRENLKCKLNCGDGTQLIRAAQNYAQGRPVQPPPAGGM